MIEKSVIMITLVGIILTGLVPVGSLILMAANKIKSSSFWAGILAYVIGFISYTLFGTIVSLFVMANNGALQEDANVPKISTETVSNPAFIAALQCICGIMLALAMVICISAPMKKTRTLKGAVSCGLGFGASYSITALINLISYYNNFASINSGRFDSKYINLIDIGYMDKETLNMLKEQYTSIKASDLVVTIATTVVGAALMIAAAVIVMRFICVKKTPLGTLTAIAAMAVVFVLPVALPNVYIGLAAAAAVVIAVAFFAVKVKDDIVPPERPSYAGDSFMQSVAGAKADNSEISNVNDFLKK